MKFRAPATPFGCTLVHIAWRPPHSRPRPNLPILVYLRAQVSHAVQAVKSTRRLLRRARHFSAATTTASSGQGGMEAGSSSSDDSSNDSEGSWSGGGSDYSDKEELVKQLEDAAHDIGRLEGTPSFLLLCCL